MQHASPGASYAHTANRDWYADSDLTSEAVKNGCRDIAYQLVHNTEIDVNMVVFCSLYETTNGKNIWACLACELVLFYILLYFWLSIQVILGGGRQYMYPTSVQDPEYPSSTGSRKDGQNLITEWRKNKKVNMTLYTFTFN